MPPRDPQTIFTYIADDAHGLLLLSLWAQMAHDHSLYRVMFPDAQSPVDFLRALARTGDVFMSADDAGPWAAAWITPVLSGASYNIWVRTAKRPTRAHLRFVLETLRLVFGRFQVVAACTRDPRQATLYAKLGFTLRSVVPHLYNGDTAILQWLTRERFTTYTLETFSACNLTRWRAAHL